MSKNASWTNYYTSSSAILSAILHSVSDMLLYLAYGILTLGQAIQLFKEEYDTAKIAGMPESWIQGQIAEKAAEYNVNEVEDLLLSYPRYKESLEKLVTIYLQRFNNLAKEELRFFLKIFPHFLNTYTVKILPPRNFNATRKYVCRDYKQLAAPARNNFDLNFPHRAKMLREHCGMNVTVF
ncbi:unnamed protein product [Cylicocyclus nassatus]|uniref:Uncharacterized protein n=1 Tax=Cylicocyclus nassatus TaxID=53992 RepID=A0AA36M5G6_CYLNA|nr:unnamed protein product [Cylicocyclus nassatus]